MAPGSKRFAEQRHTVVARKKNGNGASTKEPIHFIHVVYLDTIAHSCGILCEVHFSEDVWLLPRLNCYHPPTEAAKSNIYRHLIVQFGRYYLLSFVRFFFINTRQVTRATHHI